MEEDQSNPQNDEGEKNIKFGPRIMPKDVGELPEDPEAPVQVVTTEEVGEPLVVPLQTMKGDLSRLMNEKKISEREMDSLDKKLKKETLAYHKAGGDDEFIKKLNTFLEEKSRAFGEGNEISENIPAPSINDEVNTLINNTSRDFISNQIPKARQRTEDIKINIDKVSEETGGLITKAPVPDHVTLSDTPSAKEQSEQAKTTYSATDEVETVGIPPRIEDRQPIPEPHKNDYKPAKKKIDPIIKLKTEQTKLEHELNKFPAKEKVFDDQVAKLEEKRERLLNFLDPLKEREQELEVKEAEIESARAEAVDEKSRRELEERRWIIEDRLREVEQNRWKADQEIINIQTQIQEIALKKEDVLTARVGVEEQIKANQNKQYAISAVKEREDLVKKLDIVEHLKEPLELEFVAMNEKRKIMTHEIERLTNEVEAFKDKVSTATLQERETTSAQEQHEVEVDRWNAEEQMRASEKQLWKNQDDLEKVSENVLNVKNKYQKIIAVEEALHNKIKQLETLALEGEEELEEL